MKKTLFIFTFIASVLFLSSCFYRAYSPAWFQDIGKAKLESRAAFDLDCPKEELTYTPLSDGRYRSVGVRGCNKKAAYVFGKRGWLLNSAKEKNEQ